MIYKKRSIFLWGILSLAPLYATHIDFPNPYKAKYAVNAYKDSGTTVYSPNGLSLKNGAQFNGATGISNISISAAPSDKSVGGTIGWTDSGYPDHLEIKLPHESTRTAGNQVILTVHDDKVQKPLIIPSMDDSAYFHKKTIKNNLDVDCVLQAFTKGDGSTNSTKINLYLKNSYGAPQVIQDISISKGSTVDVYLLIKDVYDQKYQPIDNWSILIYDHTYTINFPSDSSDSTITLLDHVHSKYIKNSTDKTITVTVNGSDSTNKGTFTVDNGKQVTWYNEASGFASLDIVVGTQKITLSHSGGTNSKGDSSYTLNDIIGLEINMQQDSSNSPAYVVVGIEDNHGKFSQYVPDKPSGTPQASTLMYLDVQCTSEKNIRLQYYNASNQLLQSFPYDGSSQLIDFVVSNTHGSRLTTATYDPSLIDHIVCTVGTGSSTTNFVADSTFNPLTIFASQATALKNGIDASPGTKMATVSFGAQNSDGSIPVSFFVDSNSTDGLYSTKITTTASGSGSTTTNSNYKLNNTSGWDLDISIIKKDNSLSSSVRVTKDNKPQNIYYDTNDIKGIQISPVLTTSGAPIAVLNTLIWYTGDSKVQNVLQSAEAIAFNNIDGVSNDKSTGVHVYFYSSKTDLSKSSLDILLPNSSSSGSITNAITASQITVTGTYTVVKDDLNSRSNYTYPKGTYNGQDVFVYIAKTKNDALGTVVGTISADELGTLKSNNSSNSSIVTTFGDATYMKDGGFVYSLASSVYTGIALYYTESTSNGTLELSKTHAYHSTNPARLYPYGVLTQDGTTYDVIVQANTLPNPDEFTSPIAFIKDTDYTNVLSSYGTILPSDELPADAKYANLYAFAHYFSSSSSVNVVLTGTVSTPIGTLATGTLHDTDDIDIVIVPGSVEQAHELDLEDLLDLGLISDTLGSIEYYKALKTAFTSNTSVVSALGSDTEGYIFKLSDVQGITV